MIKHYFGFALFSFIVGTSAVIYAMVNVVNVNEVTVPSYSTYSPGKSCWKMKRESRESNISSPTIRQAVINLKTKQLKWELDTSQVNTPIALNFFIKGENGTRYVSSTFLFMIDYQDGSVDMTSFCEWLKNLDSYENLYVIAESVPTSAYKNKNFQPIFDQSKATAVLVY
jgi:hypothetical protein